MLRNLNQSSGGQRVCGTPKSGVLGSLIPSTGDNGAGYTYNDLSLPADNTKEICGRITSWPSAGTLTAYEDTSFEFSGAPDGVYSFQYQLYVDGVAVGPPASVGLTVGYIAASATFAVTTADTVFSGGSANGSGGANGSAAGGTGISTGIGSGGMARGNNGLAPTVFVKASGIYEQVSGVYVKQAGLYQQSGVFVKQSNVWIQL